MDDETHKRIIKERVFRSLHASILVNKGFTVCPMCEHKQMLTIQCKKCKHKTFFRTKKEIN